MSEAGLSLTYPICSAAAGVAGNLLALVLFVSPIPTFRRIIRSRSTEEFSGLPYIYALLNCLICLWYGMPVVSSGIILIATVNSVGAMFQLIYITIFIVYADKERKLKMLGSLLAVFSVFAIIVSISIRVFEPPDRQLFVGYLSVFSLISMFASPLFIIVKSGNQDKKHRIHAISSVICNIIDEPLLLRIWNVQAGSIYFFVPNGVGAILGIIQLVLYFCYSTSYVEVSRKPLLESNA
ncbi:hypothetical protein OROMI_022164 [Orobanche minor]